MSVEQDIKAAVEQARPADDDFRLLRSEIHAAVIEAHRRLGGGRRWSDSEVRLLDIVDTWMNSFKRDRSK